MLGSTRITRLGYQSPLLFVTQYEHIQIKSHVTSPLSCKKKKKKSPLYQILSETFHPCTLHACSSSPHVSKTALLEVTDSSFPTRNEDAQLLWVQQGAKLPSGKTHLHGPLHKNACQHHGCTEYFHLLLQLPPL